jgi:hypothetical protein
LLAAFLQGPVRLAQAAVVRGHHVFDSLSQPEWGFLRRCRSQGVLALAVLPMLFLASAFAGRPLLVVRFLLCRQEQAGSGHHRPWRLLRKVALVGYVYFVFEFAEFSIALWNPNVHVQLLS